MVSSNKVFLTILFILYYADILEGCSTIIDRDVCTDAILQGFQWNRENPLKKSTELAELAFRERRFNSLKNIQSELYFKHCAANMRLKIVKGEGLENPMAFCLRMTQEKPAEEGTDHFQDCCDNLTPYFKLSTDSQLVAMTAFFDLLAREIMILPAFHHAKLYYNILCNHVYFDKKTMLPFQYCKEQFKIDLKLENERKSMENVHEAGSSSKKPIS